MGIANLKLNIVCMRYPEMWREERNYIPETFVSIINDCTVANKAVVIVAGLSEWPNEYQKQDGSIGLHWIVWDGGLMFLLSQLLRAKRSFENCNINVFCIAEEDIEDEDLKVDVKKFLYDLRMWAEVIVMTMRSWQQSHKQNSDAEILVRGDAISAFLKARKRIILHLHAQFKLATEEGEIMQHVDTSLHDTEAEQHNEKIFYNGSCGSFSVFPHLLPITLALAIWSIWICLAFDCERLLKRCDHYIHMNKLSCLAEYCLGERSIPVS